MKNEKASMRWNLAVVLCSTFLGCGTPVEHSQRHSDSSSADTKSSCGNGICETQYEDYVDCPADCEVECLHDSNCDEGQRCSSFQCLRR